MRDEFLYIYEKLENAKYTEYLSAIFNSKKTN